MSAAWDTVLGSYRELRAKAEALTEADADWDTATIDQCDVADLLFETPAPDLPAVAIKLEVGRDEYGKFALPDRVHDLIIADLKRLAEVRT